MRCPKDRLWARYSKEADRYQLFGKGFDNYHRKNEKIPWQLSPIKHSQFCIYVYWLKTLHLHYIFTHEPSTDSIIVSTGKNTILVIRCKECNSSVIFNEPNDIVYLYRLAGETPLAYAKLALKENGLLDYVDAMNWFNY